MAWFRVHIVHAENNENIRFADYEADDQGALSKALETELKKNEAIGAIVELAEEPG